MKIAIEVKPGESWALEINGRVEAEGFGPTVSPRDSLQRELEAARCLWAIDKFLGEVSNLDAKEASDFLAGLRGEGYVAHSYPKIAPYPRSRAADLGDAVKRAMEAFEKARYEAGFDHRNRKKVEDRP